MFTVEMDWDEVAINVLDETAQHEDVQCLMYEDVVYIRQWNDRENRYNTVAMTNEMFDELQLSFNEGEGAYRRETIQLDDDGDYDYLDD